MWCRQTLHAPADRITWFLLARPRGGIWQVQTLPGSSRVVQVREAGGLPQPHVTGRVSGRGHTRTLNYHVKPLPGQTVTFAEVGNGAAAPLGAARGPSGQLVFHPAAGPGGVRSIIARVTSYGIPRTNLTIAHYIAPPPVRPAAPGHVTLRRARGSVIVTWDAVIGATQYRVRVRLSDRRRLYFFITQPRRHSVTIRHVANSVAGRITIDAVAADGYAGRAAVASLKAQRKHRPGRRHK